METMMTETEPLGQHKRFYPAAEIAPGVSSPDHKRPKTVIGNSWVQAPVDQHEIEKMAGHIPVSEFCTLQHLHLDKEINLLPPYDPYEEDCPLDLYQRLVVNNPSTHYWYSRTWSTDLARDQQYVQFYEILESHISDKVPCRKDFTSSEHPYGFLLGSNGVPDPLRVETYETYAYELAQRHAKNLTHDDIRDCIMDIIKEKWQFKPYLEYSKEFQLYLLDSGYEKGEFPLEYLSWKIGDKIPISRSIEINKYQEWLFLPHICSMNKDEKRKELEKLHNEISDQYCRTKIHYLKLKLKLAEKIGLIVKTTQPEFAISS